MRLELGNYIMLILLAIVLTKGVIVSESYATRALEDQGYSDVEITKHAWVAVGLRGCDRFDSARFTAKAKNPAGKPTEVYLCTGAFLKGGTVRSK